VELVSEVCGRYDIAKFAVFGSAARGDIPGQKRPADSDPLHKGDAGSY
jgi:predicted nucleotidyltransferase